jgi:hypothetical protein
MEGNWLKSTYSSGADNCVELLHNRAVRDTKDRSKAVAVSVEAWAAFLEASKSGAYVS